MLFGIVAGSDDGGSGGGAGDLSDAVAYFDFVNEVYEIDGAPVTVGDNIDRDDLIVPGSGLFIDWDVSGAFATVIGDLLAKVIASEWTIVMQAVEENDTGNFPLLDVFAAATTHDALLFTTQSSSFANISVTTPGLDGDAFAQVVVTDRPNRRRIAVTRTAAKVVISANGSAIVSDPTATTPSYDSARIGAQKGSTFPDMKGYIEHFIVLPVRDDTDPPALSDL